jgi:hypothetical protein
MTRTAITALLLLAMAIGALVFPVSASAEQGVRLYGFVYDRTGLPVVNATITLLLDNVSLPTGSNPAITDVQGYYEFAGIQPGVYCLVAEKNAFAYSTTIRLQTGDLLVNFNLQGRTADMVDISATPATPSPTAVPEIVTATPAPSAPDPSPGASAAPGFDIVIALLGLFLLGLMKMPK